MPATNSSLPTYRFNFETDQQYRARIANEQAALSSNTNSVAVRPPPAAATHQTLGGFMNIPWWAIVIIILVATIVFYETYRQKLTSAYKQLLAARPPPVNHELPAGLDHIPPPSPIKDRQPITAESQPQEITDLVSALTPPLSAPVSAGALHHSGSPALSAEPPVSFKSATNTIGLGNYMALTPKSPKPVHRKYATIKRPNQIRPIRQHHTDS